MILFRQNIDRSILLEILSKGKCNVTFVKLDNSTRRMLCTLNSDLLPGKYSTYGEKISRSYDDPDLMPVWDVEKGDWRSFRISNTLSVETVEEKNKEGHSTPSEDSKDQDKNKKNIKKTFQERVLEQKIKAEENRKQAKSIMDKIRSEAEQRRLMNG
jgi:predicted DNA-binding transcriptional regulator YafY